MPSSAPVYGVLINGQRKPVSTVLHGVVNCLLRVDDQMFLQNYNVSFREMHVLCTGRK
jgi:hypothetical protein